MRRLILRMFLRDMHPFIWQAITVAMVPVGCRRMTGMSGSQVFEDESNLTPLGLQVKGMLQRVWENARGNGGKLSKLGALQHQGIAHRMFERYPQIFAVGNAVKARSSVVDRCAKSMQAFTSELHSLQPGLNLDVKTDSADMAWIAYVSPEVKALENRTHVQAQVLPRRFLLQLFKDVS